jgi:hypothetical protein
VSSDPGSDELPEQYALGLRLRWAGLDDAAVAWRLGVEPKSAPSLLRLTEPKLAHITTTRVSDDPQPNEVPRAIP